MEHNPGLNMRKMGLRTPPETVEAGAAMLLRLAAGVGGNVSPGARVLDLGCGIGDSVRYFLRRGLDAWGVDLKEYWGADFDQYWEYRELPADEAVQRLKVASLDPYHLPFDDNAFDLAVSTQVFEHVQDYVGTLRELGRVLKPDGVSVHVFPARWRLMEGHVNAPLAGVFQSPAYLKAWALVTSRIPAQRHMRWYEQGQITADWLSEETNYLTDRAIYRAAREAGVRVSFAPTTYAMMHPGTIGKIIRRLPRLARPAAAAVLARITQRLMVVRPG